MRSIIAPNKKDIARLNQETYDSQVEVCEDNNAMFFEALNEEFGFGADRIKRLIKRFNVISQRYTEYMLDGYTDKEIHEMHCEALMTLGLEPDTVYSGKNAFNEAKLIRKMAEKNTKPTFAEAAFAHQHMQAMKDMMNDVKSGQLSITKTKGLNIDT